MLYTFLVFLSILTAATGDVLHLTADNYDSLTADKSVFIKYYAPWVSNFNDVPDTEVHVSMRTPPLGVDSFSISIPLIFASPKPLLTSHIRNESSASIVKN